MSKSNEEYLMIPNCGNKDTAQELVIHLAEEVAVDEILAENNEDFSASLKAIHFYGSSDYPSKKWQKIG